MDSWIPLTSVQGAWPLTTALTACTLDAPTWSWPATCLTTLAGNRTSGSTMSRNLTPLSARRAAVCPPRAPAPNTTALRVCRTDASRPRPQNEAVIIVWSWSHRDCLHLFSRSSTRHHQKVCSTVPFPTEEDEVNSAAGNESFGPSPFRPVPSSDLCAEVSVI